MSYRNLFESNPLPIWVINRTDFRFLHTNPAATEQIDPGAALDAHHFAERFGLFIIIGLLSIVPTLEFLSWRDAIAAGQVPVMDAATRKRVTMIIHIELAAIVVILLCAAIMARGGWV